MVGREGWEKRFTHIRRLFYVLYNLFCFVFFGGGGGGGGERAIFALAVSIQLKCYLSPSHLHLPYFLVSRRLPVIYSTWAPPPVFSAVITSLLSSYSHAGRFNF